MKLLLYKLTFLRTLGAVTSPPPPSFSSSLLHIFEEIGPRVWDNDVVRDAFGLYVTTLRLHESCCCS